MIKEKQKSRKTSKIGGSAEKSKKLGNLAARNENFNCENEDREDLHFSKSKKSFDEQNLKNFQNHASSLESSEKKSKSGAKEKKLETLKFQSKNEEPSLFPSHANILGKSSFITETLRNFQVDETNSHNHSLFNRLNVTSHLGPFNEIKPTPNLRGSSSSSSFAGVSGFQFKSAINHKRLLYNNDGFTLPEGFGPLIARMRVLDALLMGFSKISRNPTILEANSVVSSLGLEMGFSVEDMKRLLTIFPEFCVMKPIFFGNPNSNLVNKRPQEAEKPDFEKDLSENLEERARPDVECLLNGGAVIFHRPETSDLGNNFLVRDGFSSLKDKSVKRRGSEDLVGAKSLKRRRENLGSEFITRESDLLIKELPLNPNKDDLPYINNDINEKGRKSLVNLAELLDTQSISETLDRKLSGSIVNIHPSNNSPDPKAAAQEEEDRESRRLLNIGEDGFIMDYILTPVIYSDKADLELRYKIFMNRLVELAIDEHETFLKEREEKEGEYDYSSHRSWHCLFESDRIWQRLIKDSEEKYEHLDRDREFFTFQISDLSQKIRENEKVRRDLEELFPGKEAFSEWRVDFSDCLCERNRKLDVERIRVQERCLELEREAGLSRIEEEAGGWLGDEEKFSNLHNAEENLPKGLETGPGDDERLWIMNPNLGFVEGTKAEEGLISAAELQKEMEDMLGDDMLGVNDWAENDIGFENKESAVQNQDFGENVKLQLNERFSKNNLFGNTQKIFLNSNRQSNFENEVNHKQKIARNEEMQTPAKDREPSLLPQSEYNSAYKKKTPISKQKHPLLTFKNGTPAGEDLLKMDRVSQTASRVSYSTLQAPGLVSPLIDRSNRLTKKKRRFKKKRSQGFHLNRTTGKLNKRIMKHIKIKNRLERENSFSKNLQSVLGDILDKRTAYDAEKEKEKNRIKIRQMKKGERRRKMSSKEGTPIREKPNVGLLSVSKRPRKADEPNPFDLSSKKPQKPGYNKQMAQCENLLGIASVSDALSSQFSFHSPKFSDGSFHPHNIRKEVIGYFRTRGYKTVFLHYLMGHLKKVFRRADEGKLSEQLREFFGTNLGHFKMLEVGPGQCLIKPLLGEVNLV